MIAEPLDLKLDIEKLKSWVEKTVLPLPPAMEGRGWGGWSVTSVTGSYRDGWYPKTPEDEAKFVDGVLTYRDGFYESDNQPTEICVGYIKEVIKTLEDLGLCPRRIRLTFLRPGVISGTHQDINPHMENYNVRLHIPIITNPMSVFCTTEGCLHLPADGNGYFVRVNQPHYIKNEGERERYHLIMNVRDTKKASKEHAYHGANPFDSPAKR